MSFGPPYCIIRSQSCSTCKLLLIDDAGGGVSVWNAWATHLFENLTSPQLPLRPRSRELPGQSRTSFWREANPRSRPWGLPPLGGRRTWKRRKFVSAQENTRQRRSAGAAGGSGALLCLQLLRVALSLLSQSLQRFGSYRGAVGRRWL